MDEIEGWMTEDELDWLYSRATEAESVLEIGTWKGRSTAALAQGCAGPVVTVDHFQGSPSELDTDQHEALTADLYAEARKNLARFPNVEILPMSSEQAAEYVGDRTFGMVFIDGDHTAEAFQFDLDLWIPHTTGLFCGHDRGHPGVAAVLAGFDWVEYGPGSLWWFE